MNYTKVCQGMLDKFMVGRDVPVIDVMEFCASLPHEQKVHCKIRAFSDTCRPAPKTKVVFTEVEEAEVKNVTVDDLVPGKKSTIGKKVVDCLLRNGKKMRGIEISTAIGIPPKRVSNALRCLVASGAVHQEGEPFKRKFWV